MEGFLGLAERVLSVSQINEYVRRTLAADPMLRGVRMRGEISNFKRHTTGHLYFTLKDDAAKIACVMFRSQAASLMMAPRDGMRVVLSGSVSLYSATGQYQFYVDTMRDDGVGDLFLAFEQLKHRLSEEGLFDASLKKPLPLLPRGVGIVTSKTGAVLHDIMQVSARRHPGIQLVLCPASVQGEGAAQEIVRAIAYLDKQPDIDVIIVGRGGGSLEELWPFNEEAVARAILACQTPIVSAVGHETDTTIADFVADVRAATPSHAAELVVPSLVDLYDLIDGQMQRLSRAQAQRMAMAKARLDSILARLLSQRPDRRIESQRAALDAHMALLFARVQALVRRRALAVDALRGRLEALSPDRVMERGYAVVRGADGNVLKNADDIAAGERLLIRLGHGTIDALALEVLHGNGKEKSS